MKNRILILDLPNRLFVYTLLLIGNQGFALPDFETARVQTIEGLCRESDTMAEFELKATSMRDGAKCLYRTSVNNGRFSCALKLFPGQNLVTARTASGTDERILPLTVEKPTLRIQMSCPGNDGSYRLFVNGLEPFDETNFYENPDTEVFILQEAEAGLYRIMVVHFAENENPAVLPTTVRVEVNGDTVCTRSNADGKEMWSVGTFVLHAGDQAGGYAVDANKQLDVACQYELKGYSPSYLPCGHSISQLTGPNGSDPVYLSVGEAAQFNATGAIHQYLMGADQAVEFIDRFTNSDTKVGDIDALGVFLAKAPGHTQIACQEYPGAPIDVYVIHADLVPDLNHDRVIDSSDENMLTVDNPVRFWINDDNDSSDIANDDSDTPGQQAGVFGHADYDNNHVDGRCDLIDFFPIWLDLNHVINLFPAGSVDFKLKQVDNALKAVYTDLTNLEAGLYLTNPSNAQEAELFTIPSSGISLSADFIKKIRDDKTKGVLLLEGANTTTAALILEIWKDGSMIGQRKMPLNLSCVENMYRRVNLRNLSTPDSLPEPTNNPDRNCKKNVIFLHGFNVSSEKARGWNAEIFKRLWQSGSRAKFHGVTWRGDDHSMLDPLYQSNVTNAFITAIIFKNYVKGLLGENIVLGHSLGNMVVSSAIADHNAKIDK